MTRHGRPVQRDDGKVYMSMSEAARDLLAEWGVTPNQKLVAGIQRDIGQCLRGNMRTVRGHRWAEYDPPMTRGDLIKLISDMRDALAAASVPREQLGDIPVRCDKAIGGRRGK